MSRSARGRRLAGGTIAAALLAVSAGARADGFGFVGDLPSAPHVMLDLADEQRQAIARLAGQERHRHPEIRLTPAQREILRRETGQEVPWVFAATKEALQGDCSCGAYNLGVVVGDRLAVLRFELGDYPAPGEVDAIAQALTDVALRNALTEPAPTVTVHGGTQGKDIPEALRAIAGRFPGDRFARTLALTGGWRAQRLRLAAMPRLQGGLDPLDLSPWLAQSAVASTPIASTTIQWPELGARLEEGRRVVYLVPGVVEGELGPEERAWVVLEYDEGRLLAFAAVTGWGWSGAIVEWPLPGSER